MTTERIKTTVTIAGRDYTITGADSEEHIQRVATYVDRKMEELRIATHLPPQMVAVLTAMNVADELIKAQDENARLRKDLAAQKARAAKRAAKKVAEE